MRGNVAIGCNIIDELIARLAAAGDDLLTDPADAPVGVSAPDPAGTLAPDPAGASGLDPAGASGPGPVGGLAPGPVGGLAPHPVAKPADPASQVARESEMARLLAAFPFVAKAPDWLAFLRRYGGLTYVRGTFSSGFFGVSYSASLHILDGEGEPIENGYLLFCDADPPLFGACGFAFDATGTRRWGVHGVTADGDGEWCAPTFTAWLERFVDAVT